MKSFFIIIVAIFILCSGAFAFSPSIVVQMAQHDSKSEVLRESTFILENGVLDTFFEAGYIVSSLPTSINKEIKDILKETTQTAREGYMSYVVYINVYYRSYDIKIDETIAIDDIESINWQVVNAKDMSVLGEGKTQAPSKVPGENDLLAMRRFSNDLGADIKREFEKNYEGI